MYVRVHAWMCVEVRGRGGMCAASKKPRSGSVCHGRPIGRRHKQRRYAATARYVPCTFFFFLKRIKYTICFPWPPLSGPLLFALPTVSEPTLDAKSWHACQRSDSWWGGGNRCQRAANSSPGFCPRETGQSDKQEMKTQRFRGGRNRTRADCLDFRGFGSFPCFFFLIFS